MMTKEEYQQAKKGYLERSRKAKEGKLIIKTKGHEHT